MQRVALDEVTHLRPSDDKAAYFARCELLGAQPDARPLRSVASRHSQGLPAGQAVRPLLDPLVGDARPGIGLRERLQRQPVPFLFSRPHRKAINAASGALSSTFKSALAAPVGQRLPCSQLRMVSSDTSIRSANSD